MAPSAPKMSGDAPEPIGFGRLVASMFKFKRVRRNIGMRHTRVYRCEIRDNQLRHIDEEPIGVTVVRNPALSAPNVNPNIPPEEDIYWTKVGSQWMSSNKREKIFLRAYPVTEAEYGTDLAFGLWPELRSSNRPFRSWRKLNNHLLKKWSVLIATLSLGGVSYAASQADGAINNWFIVSMCMGAVATVSCIVFLVTNDFEW